MQIRSLIVCGLSAALAACVSVLPEPAAPDALYNIPSDQKLSGLSQDLVVREPESTRLFAGQGLVSEGDDGGLRMVSGAEWSAPATRLLQFAIIDSFEMNSNGSAVAPELGVLADFELASRVSALKLQGQTAKCSLVVSLISARDRDLLAQTEITAQATAADRSARARALALSAAASDCAMQASQFAIDTLQSGS